MNKLIAMAAPIVAVVVVGPGCKGETKVKDSPQTIAALQTCQSTIKDKEKYIKDLNARVAELKGGGASEEGIVVTFKGPPWKITGVTGAPKGGKSNGGPKFSGDIAKLSETFIQKVNLSRGRIKKCYTLALKKDSGLQARTINLKIKVRYAGSGKVASARFSPQISSSFASCMRRVSQRWTVPAPGESISLDFPNLTLTPN
jgi:hypothetical protein